MSPETVVTLIQRAMEVMVLLCGPVLLATLVAGLIISIFQAATQINEATLSFIPKLNLIVCFSSPTGKAAS